MGKIYDFCSGLGKTLQKKAPTVMIVCGIVGFTGTVILAVKETPKAIRLMEERKKELGKDKLSVGEKIKTAGKCYIPAALLGVTSTITLLGANKVNLKRNAALSAACSIAETSLIEYKSKAKEVLGEKTERTIQEAIAQDNINSTPIDANNIIKTGHGNILFLDSMTKRVFESDISYVREAVNLINERLNTDRYASLNDFYYELGIDEVEIGDSLGWYIEDGLMQISLVEGSTPDRRLCWVIKYVVKPKYEYR